jgi:tetratricopeptide (TPR) repeat protein
MRSKVLFGAAAASVLFSVLQIFAQAGGVKTAAMRMVTVVTEPKALVWLDDVLRGTTDEEGKIVLKPVPAGTRKIRVRADGFKETTITLLPARKGEVKIALTKTTDEAELAFQEAEMWATRDRDKAIIAYQKAVNLRPKYAEAHLALARAYLAKSDTESALRAVAAARRARPGYAEASAVEGRIYESLDEEEKAVASFKRAITEGRGFQPEAHTGLGLLYKKKGEGFSLSGDFENANVNLELAAAELRKGVTQLSGAPDAKDVYQLLADVYYNAKRYAEAIKVYEEFLRIFPDTPEAVSIRSLMEQTRKEMKGNQ